MWKSPPRNETDVVLALSPTALASKENLCDFSVILARHLKDDPRDKEEEIDEERHDKQRVHHIFARQGKYN